MRLVPLAAATATLAACFAASMAVIGAGAARAAEEPSLPHEQWSFTGPFGTFDRASAQRGFLVYNQVCSNCHSLKEAYYRNLEGIGLDTAQIKAIAAARTVPTIGEDGQPAERPALPSDHFHAPFANEKAARAANNGALPPDQSVIVKAREGGPDYVYNLVATGYTDPPEGMKVADGLNYNKWFPGHQIAMAAPLSEGVVTYDDGTPATVPQMARDVTTFLSFIASPELEQRKRTGVKVVIFLALLTGVTYMVKRQVWSDVH